jgi:hypothetical protein
LSLRITKEREVGEREVRRGKEEEGRPTSRR